MSDAFQIDPADLEKFRDATREEVRSIFRDFEQASGGETIYVFGLFDYVDWSCPSLFYGASTLQHWKAVLAQNANSTVDLPDEYYKWTAGDWKHNGNLGSMSVVEEIIAKSGIEELEDYDEMYEARSSLRLSIEVEMMLALRELDREGLFGQGKKRSSILLTVSDEDEGAADDWRHEVSAYLLNSEDVFRRFLAEFRRGNRKKLPNIDAYIKEIRGTDLALRFQERLAS